MSDRLIYTESDPGLGQIKVDQRDLLTLEHLHAHWVLFTFGENGRKIMPSAGARTSPSRPASPNTDGDGAGLFAFDSLDQIPDAVKMINADSGCPCPPEPPHGRRLPRSVNKALPFDLQPILEGELLRLRPLRAEDWDDLYAVASDPLIWEQHPINDRYKEEVFRGFFREALESGGALIVLDSKDDRVIGSSRFHGYDKEKGEIEIGWTFLARSHWGGKYNQEMKRLMLRHAFRFVQSVSFLIGPQNLRSQRAVEKIGAVRVGSSSDGSGRESFVFQITAPP